MPPLRRRPIVFGGLLISISQRRHRSARQTTKPGRTRVGGRGAAWPPRLFLSLCRSLRRRRRRFLAAPGALFGVASLPTASARPWETIGDAREQRERGESARFSSNASGHVPRRCGRLLRDTVLLRLGLRGEAKDDAVPWCTASFSGARTGVSSLVPVRKHGASKARAQCGMKRAPVVGSQPRLPPRWPCPRWR